MINQSQWQNDWPTGGGCRPQLITLTFTRSIHSRSNIVSIATVRYNTWKIGGKSPENNKSETTNRKFGCNTIDTNHLEWSTPVTWPTACRRMCRSASKRIGKKIDWIQPFTIDQHWFNSISGVLWPNLLGKFQVSVALNGLEETQLLLSVDLIQYLPAAWCPTCPELQTAAALTSPPCQRRENQFYWILNRRCITRWQSCDAINLIHQVGGDSTGGMNDQGPKRCFYGVFFQFEVLCKHWERGND